MGDYDALKVVLAFMRKMDEHDVEGLCALMTEDHCFYDALGNCVRGKEAARGAWVGYFKWFPDYRVSHKEILHQGNLVAVFGTARGSFAGSQQGPPSKPWEIPAAWKAVVADGLVAEWRVYADNQPARQQMGDAIL